MIKLGPFRLYGGVHVYGWWMLGVGWKADLFFGLSVNTKTDICQVRWWE